MEQEKKKKKIVVILIVFLLIILTATYVTYSYFTKNVAGQMLKKEMLEVIGNHDLSFFLEENELYEAMSEKIENNNFETDSEIKMSTTMQNNMFSNFDLSNFQLTYYLMKDNENNKTYNKLQTKYAGNDLLTFDFLTNQTQIAVKSDEIVNRYVGVNQTNFQKTVNEIYEENVDLSEFEIVNNFLFKREPINLANLKNLKTYASFIEPEILPQNISKKENVVVTMNSEQITTTEYTISFANHQVVNILQNISKNIENDTNTLSELVASEVQNIENGILEYTDNDNTTQVSGEENNFETSLEIWGENTTNETTNMAVPSNNTITQDNTVANTVTNETVNQVTNQTANEVTNESNNQVPSENTVNTSDTVENNNAPEEEPPQEITQQPANEPVETPQENEQPQPENPTPTIEEEDNFRTQGFIGVNEDSEFAEDNFIIGENYEETLKNMTYWIEKIDWKTYLFTGAKANCTQEELIEAIEQMIDDRIEQNHTLKVTLYVSEGKLIKIKFSVPETMESFDVEIVSKGDQEKYLNITSLQGEQNSSSGNTISIYRKKSDTIMITKLNMNQISKNKITHKTNIDIQTKGSVNAKKYTTHIDIQYLNADGELKANLENTLNFDVNPEIEDLSDENCLFLDTLSSEELRATAKAIQEKFTEVLREKNRNLNILEVDNSNLIVQPEEPNLLTEEEIQAKEQAKQALIKTIADKMRDYQNEGKSLKIEDLEDLQIPDYEVSISVSSNLAIITVNGYDFKLDSDFNLSDS